MTKVQPFPACTDSAGTMASADFSRFVITACLEARPRDLSSYGRILSILCLPHLLQSFRIAIGLQCSLPPYPRPKALYVVPVRLTRCLPRASFRFYLAIDTLASGWTLPAIRARWGLAPVRIRSCWTNKEGTVFFAHNRPVVLQNALLFMVHTIEL